MNNHHRKIIALLIMFLLILHVWLISVAVMYPLTAILVEKNGHNQWVITDFEKDDIGIRLNLEVGDIVESIDGHEPERHFSISTWNSISQFESIVVSRNGVLFETSTDTLSNLTSTDYISILGGIICFILAFIIYQKIGQTSSAKILSLILISFDLIYVSTGASGRGDALGKFIIGMSLMTLPILFLHFFILFFNEKGNKTLPTSFLKWLYAIPAISILLRGSLLVPAIANYFYKYNVALSFIYFMFGLVCNFIILGYIYGKYRKTNQYFSLIIKTVFVSLLISFLPFLLSFVPFIIFRTYLINPVHASWFILLFPISFTYFIMAKRFYDLDIILRRIVFTLTISLLPSCILVVFNTIFTHQPLDFAFLLFQFVITMIIISLLLYRMDSFTGKLDVIIFPRKHQLQEALKKISTNLRTIQNFRELKDIVLVDIMTTLEVLGGALALRYKDDVDTICTGEIDEDDIRQQIASGQLDEENYSFFDINRNEEYKSYLIMSRKSNHTLLNQEDKQWLGIIISYLAVSLENIYLIHKLHIKLHELAAQITDNPKSGGDLLWLRRSMFEIQERERNRIALDLHDTTMQDIILLRRKLLAFTEQSQLTEFQKEKLEQFVHHLELVNENLRYNCFELNPHQLEQIGLINSIKKLVEMEMITNDYEIDFDVQAPEAIEVADIELKKHLFRIVQEMFNNAKKHSEAAHIRIALRAVQNSIHLSYEDNGIGFDIESVNQERMMTNSGLGIQQIKSRVNLIRGSWTIASTPGSGVNIRIQVPVDRTGLIA